MADLTTSILDDALSISRQWIRPKVPDLMGKANGAFQMFFENKEKIDGCTFIQIPINPKEIASMGAINGVTDTININPQQQFSWGTLNWKHDYYSVPITLDELAKAGSTKNAIVDLVSKKQIASFNSFIRRISNNCHLSGYTTRVKEINGLADMAAASGTQYAGLTDTNTAIFSDSSDWLFDIDSSTATVSVANINYMLSKLRERTQGLFKQNGEVYDVDTIISNYAVFAELQNVSTYPAARFTDLNDVQQGIKKFNFNGCKWLIDGFSPGTKDGSTADNYLYILSSASMELKYRWGFGDPAPMDQADAIIPNQTIKFNSDLYTYNLVCNNRRVNGVFKALVAGKA